MSRQTVPAAWSPELWPDDVRDAVERAFAEPGVRTTRRALNRVRELNADRETRPFRVAVLRTFTADRTPVSGFDPAVDGLYWLVGQGGYGIHTSDALARAAAANIAGSTWPTHLADVGLGAADLAADRPTLAGPLVEGH